MLYLRQFCCADPGVYGFQDDSCLFLWGEFALYHGVLPPNLFKKCMYASGLILAGSPPAAGYRTWLCWDVVSYDVVSYDVVSYDVVSYDVVSYDVVSYDVFGLGVRVYAGNRKIDRL